MQYLRIVVVCVVLATSAAWASCRTAFAAGTAPQRAAADSHQHDFDFEWGTPWKAHLLRLRHRLAGSHDWIEYDGTLTIHKLWNGKGNISELEVGNATSHIEGGALHLYDPKAHQWSVTYVSSDADTLGVPAIGRFEHGRGVFHDRETDHGRPVIDRWYFTNISPHHFDFEQAFSADGGKTWETNLIIKYTR